jgi:hypothetical protein
MRRKKKKRSYGMGRVFRRGGGAWTISYCHNRNEIRETTTAKSKSEAKKILKQRLGAIADGKVIVSPAKQEKYIVAEMLDFLLLTHQVNGHSKAVQWPVKHLRRYFGLDRAMAITDERVLLYAQGRRNQGAADGSIKLELAALSGAFTLSIEAKKLSANGDRVFRKSRWTMPDRASSLTRIS